MCNLAISFQSVQQPNIVPLGNTKNNTNHSLAVILSLEEVCEVHIVLYKKKAVVWCIIAHGLYTIKREASLPMGKNNNQGTILTFI
jgi:hypothetical protein